MFDTVCTLPLTSELFSQALHPTEPVISVGLASGHVQTYRIPATDADGHESKEVEDGVGKIESQWRTRRHKGSCRDLAFSLDGEALYSAGTDGIVKVASASTGRVSSKIAIPVTRRKSIFDQPALLHLLSPQTLLVATDSSALYLYDVRALSPDHTRIQRPQQTYYPHDDYVSSITTLLPGPLSSSGLSKQFVTTGATTLAVTDIRRGVLTTSDDQEDELLSSVFVSGLPARHGRRGEKVVIGGAGGILTMWEKGQWRDQQERITVGKTGTNSESLDAITLLPDHIGSLHGKHLAVGTGDGRIKIVSLFPNRVVGELVHDDVDGVVDIGVAACGRLVSGGGQTIKIWVPRQPERGDDEPSNGIGASKRRLEASDNEESRSEEETKGSSDSDDDDATEKHRRKRRKKGKGKGKKAQQRKGKKIKFQGID